MLEAPTPVTTDEANLTAILDEVARQREYRKRSREKPRRGEDDALIDALDLRRTENTASADGAFAARLERAIEAGLEHDIAVTIEDAGTERPTQMIVPRVYLPEQIPAVPARSSFLSYRMSRRERLARAEDMAARRAESGDQRMIAPGQLTVLDLRAGVCHFSGSESAPYFFCGAPTGADAKPWCPEHHLVCFAPRA